MKRVHVCAAVVVLLLTISGAASAQQAQGPDTLAVVGHQLENGRYSLSLETYAATERSMIGLKERAPFGAGILVWAEPSHTLLLALWDAEQPAESTRERLRAWSPLVDIEGSLGTSHPRVTILYEPSFDEGIVIEVARLNGERETLMGAKVDMSSFNVTTKLPGAGGYKNEGYRHCCSGGDCGTMCTSCVDGYFTCDLVACTISCGW